MVVQGKGEGGVGRKRREHEHRGESRALKPGAVKHFEGTTSPTPLQAHPSQVTPATQVEGGKPSNIGTMGRQPGAAWHRPAVSPTGGRRVTTGAPGGRMVNKQQTYGEEEGGEREGGQTHQWTGKRNT